MNICKGCKQSGKTKITKMNVTHKMFNKDITVKDFPVLMCDCGYVEYLYPRELDFQLRDAYRANLKTFNFRTEK